MSTFAGAVMRESAYNVWIEHQARHYVYNGISGSLLMLDAADRREVQKHLAGGRSACSPVVLEHLVRGRMLIADDVDEFELLRRRFDRSRSDTKHLSLTLVPSLGCNFGCPYCFEAKKASVMGQRVQADVLRLVDDRLEDIEALSVNWFGGEPLLGKKALLRLSGAFIERCARAEITYSASIVSNGFLLNERTCRQLKEAQVSSAQVTLDGPPDVHDRMRPLAGGGGTFWKIIKNLHHALDYLSLAVRVNLDAANVHEAEALFQILAAEGFAGRLSLHPGQIVRDRRKRSPLPLISTPACLTHCEFARTEIDFCQMAARYGFPTVSLPKPTGVPCTALRASGLVIGSEGEIYKCWECVGNPREVIGHIADYRETKRLAAKWSTYDPLSDAECRACIALPVCMGGCANRAMKVRQHDNRCDTFRRTSQERILSFIQRTEHQSPLS